MKLHSRILGQGDPLIIMHGLFGASDNWLSIGKQLAANHTCYLLDLRNHGRSPHTQDLDYDDMSEDLYEFLTDFGLRRISLIGHSMGGMTAMNFALEYPHRVDKLIVVDIAPKSYPAMHQEILAGLRAIPLATLKSRKEADEILAAYVPSLRIRQFLLKSLYRTEKNTYAWRFHLPAISGHANDIGRGISGRFVFENPTLFIRGGFSTFILDEDKKEIRKLFPQAKILTIPEATHWIHAEKPEEFIDIVTDFLG